MTATGTFGLMTISSLDCKLTTVIKRVLTTRIHGDILLHVCHWVTYFWFFALVENLFVIAACIKCHYDPNYAENVLFPPEIIVIGFNSASDAD